MTPPAAKRPLSYTNRKGRVYYLHAGKTKLGERRYFFAKTAGDGVLTTLPAGFEIVESINAVVSLRRIDPNVPTVSEADVARVRAELARHPHLRRHRAEAVKGEIMVYEPIGGLTDEVADYLVASFQLTAAQLEQRRPQLEKGLQYSPVMRLVPVDGKYELRRMTYRGAGGWSPVLDHGSLQKLASQYLKQIGTPEFFELL